MKKANLLLTLQKKYQDGGYALVSQKTGKIFVYGKDLGKLYKSIDEKKIKDANKSVMYIPPPRVKNVFQTFLSIRFYR